MKTHYRKCECGTSEISISLPQDVGIENMNVIIAQVEI